MTRKPSAPISSSESRPMLQKDAATLRPANLAASRLTNVNHLVYTADMQKLSDQLKRAIRESGLTHYRLSKLSGVPIPPIDRFMADTRGIQLETAERLAFVLGLVLTRDKPAGQFRHYPSGKAFDGEAAKIRPRRVLKIRQK
jgi:hypothetical protein